MIAVILTTAAAVLSAATVSVLTDNTTGALFLVCCFVVYVWHLRRGGLNI